MKPTKAPPPHKASAGQGPPPPHHYTPEELHNEDVAHEESDINIRALVMSAAALIGVMIVTAGLMYALFWFLDERAKANDPQRSPLAMPATAMPATTTGSPDFGAAPEPRLLTSEPLLLKQLREREQEQLRGYGWVDQKAGRARIPIEEAKKLLLERGLPARAGTPPDPRLGTSAPAFGESSSGRTITR